MGTVYATYSQNGTLKRAVLNQNLYSKYANDPSIHNLQIYASQTLMEQAYLQEKGILGNPKSMLLG